MSDVRPHSSGRTPASSPGLTNLRSNPILFVAAAGASIVLFGILFVMVADRIASTTGLKGGEAVVAGMEPDLDGDFADIEPAVGPELAPVPTSIVESPLPLDPVVTTVPTTEAPSPPRAESSLTVGGLLQIVDPSGRLHDVALPTDWIDTGNGTASFEGSPRMSVVVRATRSGHDVAFSDYIAGLDADLADATFSATRFFSNSSYAAVGYRTYNGVEIVPDSGPRKIFGFVWIGTNTSGTTWIIDWWSDAEASRSTINSYLTFFAERYLPIFTQT